MKIYSQINKKNSDCNPSLMLNKIEFILDNFMCVDIHLKTKKIYRLLSYFIINKSNIEINSPILSTLKKKIIQIMYTLKDSDIKYYYFLLFNTIYISIKKNNTNIIPIDNGNMDELDYYLDNISYKLFKYTIKEEIRDDRINDIATLFL